MAGKAGDTALLFMFLGAATAMTADFITKSRHLFAQPQFTNPAWDLADTSQIGGALGVGTMGALINAKGAEDFAFGALLIQAYMKVLAPKYNLPRYIIFRSATI